MSEELTPQFKDPVMGFIASQLTRIERKVDALDDRLRLVEIGLVQKIEIEKLNERVTKLEQAKIKFVAWMTAGLVVLQFAGSYLMRRLGL